MVEEPRTEWDLRIEVAAAPRSGSVGTVCASCDAKRGDGDVTVAWGSDRAFTFGPVTTQIDWGDRILITGFDGSG